VNYTQYTVLHVTCQYYTHALKFLIDKND